MPFAKDFSDRRDVPFRVVARPEMQARGVDEPLLQQGKRIAA